MHPTARGSSQPFPRGKGKSLVRVPFKITTDHLPPSTCLVPENPHPTLMEMLPLTCILCLESPWQTLLLNLSGLSYQPVSMFLSFQGALSPTSACWRWGQAHLATALYTALSKELKTALILLSWSEVVPGIHCYLCWPTWHQWKLGG